MVYVFPNPFRPNSAQGGVLKFDNLLPDSKVRIYTLSGELVRGYISSGGRQIWDGRNTAGEEAATGVYLYVVDQPDGSKAIGKIFLVR